MSRLRQFHRGLMSSYLALGANILVTLVSVPLALHYLSKEHFALWALVTQIGGYLMLVDLGMTISVSRILVDHKDDRSDGRYGAVLKVGLIVFAVQGVLLLALGLAIAPWLPSWFGIAPFAAEFIWLFSWQCVILALGLATKILGVPFWCHQRIDIVYLAGTVSIILSFAAQWAGFVLGWNLGSFVASNAVALLVTVAIHVCAASKLNLYPQKGQWGRIDSHTFREIAAFGRDIFIMTLGSQLLSASQIVIISRVLGLEAAATWAICSKVFSLVQQAVSRVFEASGSAFAEMFVRGEREKLKQRMQDVVMFTAALAVAGGIIAAAINPGFVAVWTRARVSWDPLNDVLLAVLLVVYSVSRCHMGLAGLVREVGSIRFVYLFEGILFVGLAWFATSKYGLLAIGTSSVLATVLCSGIFGLRQSALFFGCGSFEILGWLTRPALLACILGAFAWIIRLCTAALPPLAECIIVGSALGFLSILLVPLLAFPTKLRLEIFGFARQLIGKGLA